MGAVAEQWRKEGKGPWLRLGAVPGECAGTRDFGRRSALASWCGDSWLLVFNRRGRFCRKWKRLTILRTLLFKKGLVKWSGKEAYITFNILCSTGCEVKKIQKISITRFFAATLAHCAESLSLRWTRRVLAQGLGLRTTSWCISSRVISGSLSDGSVRSRLK